MRFIFLCVGICLSISLISCRDGEKAFRLLTPERSGIEFANQLTPTNDLNILTYLYYYNGGGVALGDFNNDELLDIYFTSNQGADKLFLNKGELVFEDITTKAGINNSDGWTTGVTHVDINNDGLLDLYVCKVGGYENLEGANLLYVNQGLDADGIPTFREDARAFGLDISTFSTQSAFFDYDLDGDLDMFLLTHSVHPNRSYGRGENRLVRDSLIGDRLLENRNGIFRDVTGASGIFQNRIGYGLGVSVGDLNNDGFPDLYIGNDFFENDYCYRNNGDGSFTELISKDSRIFGHTTHYSMGNCISDVNNDGRMDIVSLDMLPENLQTLKSSGVEDGYPIYSQFLKNGYAPQYMQNTLHINRGENMFSEVAFQYGISATEWSWGVLVADLDLDGLKDVYITNGILGATNDMDYINFISQAHIQRKIEEGSEGSISEFTRHIPEKKVANYAFKNSGKKFVDVSKDWFGANSSFSNGCAYGDLDNDGDLDLVVNNINENAFIFENRLNGGLNNHYLKIVFNGSVKNRFGVGAKVEVFTGSMFVYEENFQVKSYLSSMPNELVVGLGQNSTVDSLRVTWPDLSVETLYGVKTNQTLILAYENSRKNRLRSFPDKPRYIRNSSFSLDFRHREEPTLDFDRDPLIPFALSNEGPGIAVADVNNDSLDDIFIGGAKMQPGELFLQSKDGQLLSQQKETFQGDALSEDTDQIFFDADNDGDSDLLVVSGGNEFVRGAPLEPRLYRNTSGQFKRDLSAFKGVEINASVVKAIDLENDGDNDVMICSNGWPGKFGEAASNLILINDGGGGFQEASHDGYRDFREAGLVNDLVVRDLDGNGFDDLIVVGDWMPVMMFLNDGKSLRRITLPDSEGWWNCVAVDDFDNDGDLDIVAGNWGDNTRLSASKDQPLELFRSDFDDNGAVETLITYFYKGRRTILSSKDELQKQMPLVKKKFQSYGDFSKAEIEDIFPVRKMKDASKKEIRIFSTCYFENEGNNNFAGHILPDGAQQSSVNAIVVDDFDNDGFKDILLAGNNYEISTQLGRLDALHGVLLMNDRAGFFKEHSGQNFDIAGPARDIKKMVIGGRVAYVVAINNDRPIVLEKGE